MTDDFNREALSIEVDLPLTSEGIIFTLERIIVWLGSPKVIRCNNGPEIISQAIQK